MVGMATAFQTNSSGTDFSRPVGGGIPWYIWLTALGVTSAMIGIHWDISWHRSIGRDTFWTPAHLAIQLCGVIAGITCGYLILWTTFTKSPMRDSSVGVLGFRGPLGAFVTAWGGFSMITSAPFDDWWHNAYGLDVKILSPPHIILAVGIFGVAIGSLMLLAPKMNAAKLNAAKLNAAKLNAAVGDDSKRLETLYLYLSGMLLIAGMSLVLEFSGRVVLHSASSYRTVCMLAPVTLAMAAGATGNRWAGSKVAGLYTVFLLGMLWILPLFPAQPKLGPVLHEVTHFVPNGFPLLLIFPAFAQDLIRPRLVPWPAWRRALVMGTVFFAVYLAVEWPFATFLQSPAARNPLFGSHYMEYFASPRSYAATYTFAPLEKTANEFWNRMGQAWLAAILASWLGMVRGEWLGQVRR